MAVSCCVIPWLIFRFSSEENVVRLIPAKLSLLLLTLGPVTAGLFRGVVFFLGVTFRSLLLFVSHKHVRGALSEPFSLVRRDSRTAIWLAVNPSVRRIHITKSNGDHP